MKTPELLSDPVYHDEDAARVYLEVTRWPDFVSCPLCGSVEKISRLAGESMGPGWWFCGACKDKFTVRVGTVMERSHIPLHKWLLAFRLMTCSKRASRLTSSIAPSGLPTSRLGSWRTAFASR